MLTCRFLSVRIGERTGSSTGQKLAVVVAYKIVSTFLRAIFYEIDWHTFKSSTDRGIMCICFHVYNQVLKGFVQRGCAVSVLGVF